MRVTKSFNITPTIKGVTLDQLPDEAWTWITGGDNKSDAVKYYQNVPWLHRAVNARASAMSSMPYVWVKGDDEKEPDELDILPDVNFPELWDLLEGDLTLYGEAYVVIEANGYKVIKDLRRLHPSTMKAELNQDGSLSHFTRSLKNTQIRMELEEVIYVWLPNRSAEILGGACPAKAALAAAGVLNSIDQFGKWYFERGTIMPMVATIDGIPSEADVQKFQNFLQRGLSGLKNAFKAVAIRSGVMSISTLGQPMDKLALSELSESKRQDIATALGVPMSLLLDSAANFATAQQDDLHFYTKTIIPEARRIEAAFNTQLFNRLDMRLKFKPDRLEVFQRQENEKAISLVTLVQNGIITINEARAELNKEELTNEPQAEQLDEPDDPDTYTRAIRSEIVDAEYETAEDHLKKWEKKAKNRWQQGKSLVFDFVSELIPAKTRADIEGRLETVSDVSDISDIFSNAVTWVNYP